MKIKRLVASISAGFDTFIDKVENHEAVAESVIQEIQASAAQVKAQLGRTNRQLNQLLSNQQKLKSEQDLWNKRALLCADSNDEQKALNCIKRAKQSENQFHIAQQQITHQQALAEQLSHNLSDIEQQIADLQLKKHSLSSRNLRAKALTLSANDDINDQANAIFDRWEVSVTRNEYSSPELSATIDPFDNEFSQAEEDAELRAALTELQDNKIKHETSKD